MEAEYRDEDEPVREESDDDASDQFNSYGYREK